MKFFLELKNRIFLILIIWLYTIFACYYYKKVLFFLLFNKLILKNKTQIYFITTNITELFWIYYALINFFSTQIMYCFSCYHLFLFFSLSLYKNELIVLKKICYTLIISSQFVFYFTIYYAFPITWEFFENFQKLTFINLLYFELKINDCLTFFFQTYFLLQFYTIFIIILGYLFKKSFYNKLILKKYRKTGYFLFFVIFNLLDLTNQFLIYILFISFYEISIIAYFLNQKLKDKTGFEPTLLKIK